MLVEIKRRSHIQRMTYEDFEQRIRDGEIGERTLVRFEVVTGSDFRMAGSLELFKALADPRRRTFRRNLTRPGVPLVTAILVGFQARVYLSSWNPQVRGWLQEHATNSASAILEQGEVWRLLSYGLLHVDLSHLLFNLCFLAYTGYHLERAVGRRNLALLFAGSVFSGGLLSMAMAPERTSLGASGGDFGLLAATVILGWKHWEAIPETARKYFGWALFPYLCISILSGLQAENVDNWSHLGGLIGGIVLMTILEPEALSGAGGRNRRLRWGIVGAMLAISGFLFAAGPNLVPLTRHDARGWQVERPEYWREGWTFANERGWFSPTFRATVSVTTTIHPRPITAVAAAEALRARLATGDRELTLLSQELIEIDGEPACRLRLRFDLSGEQQQIDAVVVTRGAYEHRLQFQSVADISDRYLPLVERIVDSLVLTEPGDLTVALRRAKDHPRSPGAHLQLGEASYRAGRPADALESFRQVLTLSPDSVRALVGMLRVYADYRVTGGAEIARQAIRTRPLEPKVIEASVDVLAADGAQTEAIDALETAWLAMPGDHVLRRLRLTWGLSTELPTAGSAPPR